MLPRYFLIFLAVCLLGGCSIPRGMAFHILGTANAPIPPGGKRTSVENYPFLSFGNPAIRVTNESPQSADAVLAFYRKVLHEKGWQETPESAKKGPPQTSPSAASGQEIYHFERNSFLGTWRYAHETIELAVWDHRLLKSHSENKTVVGVYLIGHYAWDGPGTLMAEGVGNLFGPLLGESLDFDLTMPF